MFQHMLVNLIFIKHSLEVSPVSRIENKVVNLQYLIQVEKKYSVTYCPKCNAFEYKDFAAVK
jgi:hypothetical protein